MLFIVSRFVFFLLYHQLIIDLRYILPISLKVALRALAGVSDLAPQDMF